MASENFENLEMMFSAEKKKKCFQTFGTPVAKIRKF